MQKGTKVTYIAVKYVKCSYSVISISQRYINGTQPRYTCQYVAKRSDKETNIILQETVALLLLRIYEYLNSHIV